jgi:hypothetical protein
VETLRIRIEPRAHFREFLESRHRWSVLVAHRRAGKTVAVVQKLIACALTHQRPGPPLRYAYIAPTRDQAKDIAWGYLQDYTAKIPGAVANQAELKVTYPNGATIRLYSGENYERMRGVYFDGVVSDEDADIPPAAFDFVILPCLLDYDGWHTRIGTPKGRNVFWRAYRDAVDDPDSYALMLKASESGILSEAALGAMRKKLTPEAYAQEMECDFSVGRPGAIYAKFLEAALSEGRIMDFPWDRGEPVWTSWDLGAPQNTRTVYWQFIGREIHVIDHDTDLDLTPAARVAHMVAKGYPYAGHFFPHDAAASEKTGKNFQDTMQEAGLEGIRILPRCREVWPGINKCGEMFPRMVFHKEKTKHLRDSLEAYHRKEDKQSGFIRSEPVHDWASHDADAFRMMGEAMLNGMLKGMGEVIREYRPQHRRQTVAKAGNYKRI